MQESTQELFATAMALYNLTDVQPFYDPILETKALLAWNRQQVVLAFRGTASITNAWSDLQVGSQAMYSIFCCAGEQADQMVQSSGPAADRLVTLQCMCVKPTAHCMR